VTNLNCKRSIANSDFLHRFKQILRHASREWKDRERQLNLAAIPANTEEIAPLRRDRFQWMPFDKGYRLLVKDAAITCLLHDDEYFVFLVRKEGETFSLVQKAVPLETAMTAAENYVCKTVKPFLFDQIRRLWG
jgi:hypothetical protein